MYRKKNPKISLEALVPENHILRAIVYETDYKESSKI